MDINRFRLKPHELAKNCRPSVFKFASTAEVEPLKGVIGQDRAIRSLGFALDIENEGYNVYLAGNFGTGKTTLAREMLQEKALRKEAPSDWCYVNNFSNHECPQAVRLPAGLGKGFKNDVAALMDEVIKNITKAFESKEFEVQKNAVLAEFMEQTNQLYNQLEEEARTYGFTVTRTQNGVNSVPLKEDGTPLSQEEFVALPEETRTQLMSQSGIVQEKINDAFRHYKEFERQTRDTIKALELETVKNVAGPDYQELKDKYSTLEDVLTYLDEMQADVLANLEMFKATEEESSPLNLIRRMDKRTFLRRYQVNLLVDNSDLKNAPVIYESNPSYPNLFGQIEFESEFGVLTTDFSRIKAGSIHKANGGYLVLNVYDIIQNFYVWDKLKRIIKNKEIVVESMAKTLGLGNTETMQPEAIPMDIKVILIGESLYYYLLFGHDEEFQKLFKIRADFDVEMERTPRHIKEYAGFISSVCKRKGLRHFDPGAVAKMVDYGSRAADDQGKLSTLFNRLVEIIYEADCWAGYDRAPLVSAEHVRKAIAEKDYRSAMLEEKLQEYIDKGTLIINVEGQRVGELNGLAVYQMGDHQFGKPVRITAKTFMGEKGLVNIEREIQLSGQIHSKGVLTLNGYLGAQYAQDKPLSLSASLTIEQSYSGIEGDSASSAELYALLSSLAEVPIKQSIAVTGSINQNGEIQPIGGVNQKIEGFFEVCQKRGLNGQQGVMIPRQNVANLMLKEEIIAAVKARRFNIWAIGHVNEGLEILTGWTAGEKNDSGEFPAESIHYLVNRKLSQWRNRGGINPKLGLHPAPVQRFRRKRR